MFFLKYIPVCAYSVLRDVSVDCVEAVTCPPHTAAATIDFRLKRKDMVNAKECQRF